MDDAAREEIERSIDLLTTNLSVKFIRLSKAYEMVLPIFAQYHDPRQIKSRIENNDPLKTVAAIMLDETLSGELKEIREFALLLSSSARVFMTDEEQNAIIATADPIVSKYEAMEAALTS